MKKPRTVDEYLAQVPGEHRARLAQLRAIIRSAVPDAKERISYGMPFYDYKGRVAYFALARGYMGLYIPPPILARHEKELKGFKKTVSALHIPLDKKLPAALIKKLVLARVRYNEGGK